MLTGTCHCGKHGWTLAAMPESLTACSCTIWHCGCALYNRAVEAGADGFHWVAVNCRMTDPALILSLPIDHFDGHDTWADLPADGRTVKDMWF